MKSPLCILHMEDDANDAALVRMSLESAGIFCAIIHVRSERDFVATLERGGIDLILLNYTGSGFDGGSAAEIAGRQWPDIPLILVCGMLDEDASRDSLKTGVTDHVLKQHLARLALAVNRAMRDVKERDQRRSLEEQIIEGQRMEVIGQLCAGVAHDFNNILAVIMGYSDLIMDDPVLEDRLRKYAGEIRHASERAAGLTGQLLMFSRKQSVQPVVLDLNAVSQDLHKMLRRLIDENIEIVIAPGADIGRVMADAGHVGQVLKNLVVNARDAMPNGGKITITTSNVTLHENDVRDRVDATAGEYVMLSVRDTGTGMTEQVKAHLFEALYTTKAKGKGTGLGLATCQTIIRKSGGHISVCSELGKGSEFRFYYPRVDQPLGAAASPDQSGLLPRGTETLLVVEDDTPVRHLACGVLEDLGYQVLSASNGQEALHVAREHKGPAIRLAVTDVIMPQMGGMVMAEWLKVTYTDLKILFTSGYTDDALARHGVFTAGGEFLPKPYTPAKLAHRVRKLLDQN